MLIRTFFSFLFNRRGRAIIKQYGFLRGRSATQATFRYEEGVLKATQDAMVFLRLVSVLLW